jgi:hypothetical protein
VADSQNTSNFRPIQALNTVALLGVAVGVIWLAVGQHQITRDLNTVSENLKQQTEAQDKKISEKLGGISGEINQQTSVMNRALGKVIPVVMPPEWEQHLAGLEAQLKTQANWPKDGAETESYKNRAFELIKSTPAWAEADYLPRITLVRWASVAFVHLTDAIKDEDMLTTIEDINNLIGAMPKDGPAELQEKLKAKAGGLAEKQKQYEQAKAIDSAKEILVDEVKKGDVAEVARVYELLGQYEKTSEKSDKIRSLREQLRTSIINGQAVNSNAALKARWDKIRALKDEQPTIYEVSTQMVLNEIMTARVTLAMEGIKNTPYDGLEREIRSTLNELVKVTAKRGEDRQAKAVRDYQKWAMKNILEYEAKLAVTNRQAAEGSQTLGVYTGFAGWSDAKYKEVRDAMVTYLLPLNQTVLDAPVQERFQRAFKEGWDILKGREDQTYVAIMSASVEKRPLRDFLEAQP